jgi:hypothetical protein
MPAGMNPDNPDLDFCEPVVNGRLCLILVLAVTFLDDAKEFGALAVDDVEIVIGQLAPLLLSFALELLPVAFDLIPIHFVSLSVVVWMTLWLARWLMAGVIKRTRPAVIALSDL